MRAEIEEFGRLAHLTPREGEVLPWAQSAAAFGIELPADFRAFVDAFGAGEVYDRLSVNTPWPLRDPPVPVTALRAMLDDAEETSALLRDLRTTYPDQFPFAFYPEPGGLLAWASGIGGEQCFWLTEPADPDAWPVVVWDKSEWRHYAPGMLRVLLLTVTGTDPFLRDQFHDPPAPVWTPRT